MRNYEHEMDGNGNILLPDKKSAKATYGLNSKEYMDEESNPNFLREGISKITKKPIFQLTKSSSPITVEGNFAGIGEGWIAVEEQDHGGFFEHGIHKDKVIWKK